MKVSNTKRTHKPTLSLSLLALAVALINPVDVSARPFRGSQGWSVVLCKFTDSGNPPRDVNYYRDLVLNTGTGGLADYWSDVSYHNVNMGGSVVKGWYTIPKTTDQVRAMGRWDRANACLDAAKNDPTQPYTPPASHRKIIATFPDVDTWGGGGMAFVGWDVNVGALAHEGGHGFGLNHSFSNDFTFLDAWWAQIAEYDDPWDAMSWANAFSVPTPFGEGPPWMITYNLDRMGWLPRSRIVNFGADGSENATFTLAALNHPEAAGALLIRVPFDPGDPMHYYTVEFRRQDRWDAGIPADAILIHEVAKHYGPGGDYEGHYAFLQRFLVDPNKAPAQFFNDNGISIRVRSMNSASDQAVIEIISRTADYCLPGYVWREVRSYDHVCVTPSDRQQVRDENNQADSRKSPNGGAFGPDTCKGGFVWREAVAPNAVGDDPGDHVCVPPDARQREKTNNQQSTQRKNPVRVVYGPNTCKSGFVWRQADDWDWVCVTAQVRQQAQDDNAQAANRRSPTGGPFGPDTCKQGFVWRDAFPDDRVCVTLQTRSQAADDNQHAEERLLED